MSIGVGDIIKHEYARGRNLGFFKVTRIEMVKYNRWSQIKEKVIFCVLVSHLDGTAAKSKTLKERMWRYLDAEKVTPADIAKSRADAVAHHKLMITDSAKMWDNILAVLYPDSIQLDDHITEEDPNHDEEKIVSSLGVGLLRDGE
jgi:hypothetical protein